MIVYDFSLFVLRACARYWVVYLVFGLIPGAVFAQVSSVGPALVRTGAAGYVVSFASDGTPLAVGTRSVVAGATGEFLIRDMFTGAGPAGSLPLTATRTVSGAAAARAIATQAAKGFLPVALGLGAYELYEATRHKSGASGLEQDAGTSPVSETRTVYCYAYSGPTSGLICDPVRVNACKASLSDYGRYGAGFSARYVSVETGTGTCIGEKTMPGQVNNDGTTYWGEYRIGYQGSRVETTNGCPAIIDALTGASVVPGVSGDGKCATGRYGPITVDQSAVKIAPLMTAKAIDDYLASPSSRTGPIPESKPMAITGPATQVGQPVTTTTTTPSGTKSETRTPTYQYNYAGNTVTYNTTNSTVTNITNNEGDTSTETVTSDEPPLPPSDCELTPTAAGCVDLGDPSQYPKEELPKESWSFPGISPKSLASNKSCPAPLTIPIMYGQTVTFSFTPLCDICRDYLAKIVSVMAMLTSISIFVRSFKV